MSNRAKKRKTQALLGIDAMVSGKTKRKKREER
jgi:hypothetical protein